MNATETRPRESREQPSRFVQSLVNARQEQLARLFSIGMVQAGLRVTLKPDAACPSTYIDNGVQDQGLVGPGLYEVWRLDNNADGRRAVLVKLPKRSTMKGPELGREHFVFVDMAYLVKCFDAEVSG